MLYNSGVRLCTTLVQLCKTLYNGMPSMVQLVRGSLIESLDRGSNLTSWGPTCLAINHSGLEYECQGVGG
jgi:hypothetical protein